MVSTFTEEVARGAALLDTIKPDWRLKIDPETLNLRYVDTCVLGQVFDGYSSGLRAMRAAGVIAELGSAWVAATEHGFDLRDVCKHITGTYCDGTCEEAAWSALRDEWLGVIAS